MDPISQTPISAPVPNPSQFDKHAGFCFPKMDRNEHRDKRGTSEKQSDKNQTHIKLSRNERHMKGMEMGN